MAKKTRIKKVAEEVQKEIRKKEEFLQHNKTLKNILLVVGIIFGGILLFILISNSLARFEYQGVEFEKVRFCDAGPPCLVTYRTSIPVNSSGETVPYNFYIRNDPRELDVNFNGELIIRPNMVLNSEEPFICDGKGAIAAANLIQLYEVLGTSVIKDENATCDLLGRYMYVNLRQGNVTRVVQFGPSCYVIDVKDCEILEGTERFMIETFVEANKAIK